VMHDDLSARDGRDDARSRAPETPEAGQERPARVRESGKLADREVPIELTRTPDQIHAWLDGELPLAARKRCGTSSSGSGSTATSRCVATLMRRWVSASGSWPPFRRPRRKRLRRGGRVQSS